MPPSNQTRRNIELATEHLKASKKYIEKIMGAFKRHGILEDDFAVPLSRSMGAGHDSLKALAKMKFRCARQATSPRAPLPSEEEAYS